MKSVAALQMIYIYIYSTAQCSALPNWQEILLVNGTAKQRQTTQSPTNHRLEYLSGTFVPVVYWVVPQQRCCAPISSYWNYML